MKKLIIILMAFAAVLISCDYGTRDFRYPTPLPITGNIVLSGTPISVLVPTPAPTATPQPTSTPTLNPNLVLGGNKIITSNLELQENSARNFRIVDTVSGDVTLDLAKSGVTNFTLTASSPAIITASGGVALSFPNNNIFMGNLSAASGTPNSICQDSVSNEITVNAALTCTVSSIRFKHDIQPLNISALALMDMFTPISFIYNDDSEFLIDLKNPEAKLPNPNFTRIRWGLSAENMAAISPYLSEYGVDGLPNSLDFSAIFAVQSLAIQELHRKYQELENRIEALESATP